MKELNFQNTNKGYRHSIFLTIVSFVIILLCLFISNVIKNERWYFINAHIYLLGIGDSADFYLDGAEVNGSSDRVPYDKEHGLEDFQPVMSTMELLITIQLYLFLISSFLAILSISGITKVLKICVIFLILASLTALYTVLLFSLLFPVALDDSGFFDEIDEEKSLTGSKSEGLLHIYWSWDYIFINIFVGYFGFGAAACLNYQWLPEKVKGEYGIDKGPCILGSKLSYRRKYIRGVRYTLYLIPFYIISIWYQINYSYNIIFSLLILVVLIGNPLGLIYFYQKWQNKEKPSSQFYHFSLFQRPYHKQHDISNNQIISYRDELSLPESMITISEGYYQSERSNKREPLKIKAQKDQTQFIESLQHAISKENFVRKPDDFYNIRSKKKTKVNHITYTICPNCKAHIKIHSLHCQFCGFQINK